MGFAADLASRAFNGAVIHNPRVDLSITKAPIAGSLCYCEQVGSPISANFTRNDSF
jgi:hypothetical protein